MVDPGVGGPRRPILAQIDQHTFVTPDNGMLSYSMAHGVVRAVRVITTQAYLLHPVSATFHGRDVFAPVAGHLASGVPVERFGPEITDPVCLEIPRPSCDASGRLRGQVLWVDRFGNCITNIGGKELEECVGAGREGVRVLLDGRPLGRVVRFFGEAGLGGRGAVVGSTGYLELFQHQGNLAQAWAVSPGAEVAVEFAGPASPERGFRISD